MRELLSVLNKSSAPILSQADLGDILHRAVQHSGRAPPSPFEPVALTFVDLVQLRDTLSADILATKAEESSRGRNGAVTAVAAPTIRLLHSLFQRYRAGVKTEPDSQSGRIRELKDVPAVPVPLSARSVPDVLMTDPTSPARRLPGRTLARFLDEIGRLLQIRDGPQLAQYLLVEPPFPEPYAALIDELRALKEARAARFAVGPALEQIVAGSVSVSGSGELAFARLLGLYLAFIRDVDVTNLLETYRGLSELVQKCNTALAQPQHGAVLLPTIISYARKLARLAIGLDQQPQLTAHLAKKEQQQQQQPADEGVKETLPERAANILRQAFVTCLNDRSGAPSGVRDGRPDGRKAGIYTIANLCLKILFQCGKSRNA